MANIDQHAPGSFSWIELATSDQAAAKSFYASLFGWEIFDVPMGPDQVYTLFQLGGRDTAAGYQLDAAQKTRGVPTHWNIYIAVTSADETAERVAGLGGTVVAPPFDVAEQGRMAIVQDPTGASFSIWQPKQHTGIKVAGSMALSAGPISTRLTGTKPFPSTPPSSAGSSSPARTETQTAICTSRTARSLLAARHLQSSCRPELQLTGWPISWYRIATHRQRRRSRWAPACGFHLATSKEPAASQFWLILRAQPSRCSSPRADHRFADSAKRYTQVSVPSTCCHPAGTLTSAGFADAITATAPPW